MRLSLVARFNILSIVTKLMDFRVNGTFVQILQIKYYKRLTEKSRPHYIFFVPTSTTYIHSVCPNP